MKRFNVTVNGVSYDVTVEEINENTTAPAQSPVAPKATPAPAPKAAPVVNGTVGAIKVKAPMPGNIMKVNVGVGDTVKKGDVLCVLEAMKMENDISAPADGTVASVNVQKGASVQSEEVIITLN